MVQNKSKSRWTAEDTYNLVVYYLQDKPIKEIATLTGRTESGVITQLWNVYRGYGRSEELLGLPIEQRGVIAYYITRKCVESFGKKTQEHWPASIGPGEKFIWFMESANKLLATSKDESMNRWAITRDELFELSHQYDCCECGNSECDGCP